MSLASEKASEGNNYATAAFARLDERDALSPAYSQRLPAHATEGNADSRTTAPRRLTAHAHPTKVVAGY